MQVLEKKNKLFRLAGQLKTYEEELSNKIGQLKTTKELLASMEEAQAFIQQVAKATQEKIRYRLEDIVNLALTAVFGTKYRFEIRFEAKRGQTEAELLLFDGENELDPTESNGGGLCDVLSFALRVALLIISKNRKVLILDEPMKFVSRDLKQACYGIMKKLSEELHIQIIAVTHEDVFIEIADTVFKVQQKEGVSWVQNLL